MAADLSAADELAGRLVAMLIAGGETLAVVESCTGGEVGAALTRVPGASGCLWGSVVAYTAAAKRQLIGVSADVLDAHGIVSMVTTRDLARRARDLAQTTYGAAVTGWAGPGTDGPDPVGTVYLAVSGPDRLRALRCVYDGDRVAVRRAATSGLLGCLIEEVTHDRDTAS
ncbi:MAG TPA: CinA family protein [Acidobacteriota bacterium]|nr:CinA family protein [Acidobacteriota bacterium]